MKYAWIIYLLVIAYGLLPVGIPHIWKSTSEPSRLIIRRQECGCPCAQGVIVKGHVEVPESLKKLNKERVEITPVHFSPVDELVSERPETFDFANNNEFYIEGRVVGLDTILCDPTNCEVVPKFYVERWAMTSYYMRFWRFPVWGMLGYMALIFLGIPLMAFLTNLFWKGKGKRKRPVSTDGAHNHLF